MPDFPAARLRRPRRYTYEFDQERQKPDGGYGASGWLGRGGGGRGRRSEMSPEAIAEGEELLTRAQVLPPTMPRAMLTARDNAALFATPTERVQTDIRRGLRRSFIYNGDMRDFIELGYKDAVAEAQGMFDSFAAKYGRARTEVRIYVEWSRFIPHNPRYRGELVAKQGKLVGDAGKEGKTAVSAAYGTRYMNREEIEIGLREFLLDRTNFQRWTMSRLIWVWSYKIEVVQRIAHDEAIGGEEDDDR